MSQIWAMPYRMVVPWLTWLLLSVGLASLAAGLRGRVVAREPHCKSCGYTLSGIDRTPQTRCPECGRNLWLGTVMRGVRVRSRRALKLSMLLLGLAFCSFTIDVLQRLSILDWYRMRSIESLKESVGETTIVSPREHAWAELNRRRIKGRLQPEDVGDIAAIAIDRHLKMLGRSTDLYLQSPQPEHARWIQLSCAQDWLSHERTGAYVQSLIHPTMEISAPEFKRADAPLVLTLILHAEEGKGGFDAAEVAALITELNVDGVPVTLDYLSQFVQVFRINRHGTSDSAMNVQVLAKLAPGEHPVTVTVRYGVANIVVGAGPGAFAIGRPVTDIERWPHTACEWTTQRTFQLMQQ